MRFKAEVGESSTGLVRLAAHHIHRELSFLGLLLPFDSKPERRSQFGVGLYGRVFTRPLLP